RMCAHLKNKASWFLPFNKGYNDGAGNPPNPAGIATDYLWKEILRKESLANIIENYAQIVEKKDDKTGKKKREQIFPRYHQLDVVRKILASAKSDAVGTRYLIQHSAGSGKSNSISWLAHQLVDLEKNGTAVFDTIIVVTDRRVLDKQLRDNIKRFAQVSNLVGAVTEGSGQLRKFIQEGKKIIITTVQKFPFILDEIGDSHRGNKFAIIIDEAHSSQGGRTASKMNMALSNFDGCVTGSPLDMDIEDRINEIIERRKMLTNASYFAFTATPKNKTLEIFGAAYVEGDRTKHRPFHSYTMKQAIQEGFILDVLQNYTPVNSYYKLIKSVEGDPEFDIKRAKKKLRRYVESHEHAIRQKAEIMIDHFNEEVAGKYKIGGNARAMVVCSGVERAIDYYKAFCEYLAEIKLSYKAIVAFAGEFEYGGMKVTESSLNGFAGN
ncbi:MAG TPA: DEAD/DEAH box helicase family protein, partial [Candidatus Wallbacteria bacterium]|nr:DEAD/DEAH box helicase family protein [Candidatus Wallbacteria bacterium]